MEFIPQGRNSLFVMPVLYINVLSTTARMEIPPSLLEASLEGVLKVLKPLQCCIDYFTHS